MAVDHSASQGPLKGTMYCFSYVMYYEWFVYVPVSYISHLHTVSHSSFAFRMSISGCTMQGIVLPILIGHWPYMTADICLSFYFNSRDTWALQGTRVQRDYQGPK